MFALIADCFILLAGVAYPAYASFKAIKYRSVNGYVRWMCYWVVYAAYSICERTLGSFLLFWVPGYDLLRCLFVLWLVAPFTRGAQLLYKHIVHPQLSKHEAHVDTVCANYSEALKQGSTGLLRYAAGVFFQSLMKANALLFSYVQAHSLALRRANVSQIQYGNVNVPPGGFYQSAVYADQPIVGHPPALLGRPAFAGYPDQFGYPQGPSPNYFTHASVQRTFSMESLTDGFEYVDRPPPRSRSTSENEQPAPATAARMHESSSQPVRIATPKTQLRTPAQPSTSTTMTTIPAVAVIQRPVLKDETHSSVAKRSSPPGGNATGSNKKSIVSAALNAFERATSKK